MCANWEETKGMYEQLFQKPKMTEKLLSKPPFRYLHDIFTSTMGATGFGNGLFQGSDLDAKSITDKEAKINFLVKLIQLTESVIGEQIDVKPSKIVAGQEAEKTNAFLQAMFQAATAGIDTTPHVQQMLGVAGGDDGGADDGAAAAQAAEEEALRQQQEAEMAKQEEKKRRAKEKERQAKKKREEEERLRQQQEE